MTVGPLVEEDPRERRLMRAITAPEGVVLQVRLASFGERATAVVLDLVLICAVFAVLFLIVFLLPWRVLDGSAALILLVLISFAIRSFYFAYFELKWRGATPGKRAMHLRVIDRQGGPLRVDAVMARNLMREVELFLPLTLLLVLDFAQDERWVTALALVWSGILALLPLFNRDRLRAGDLIAGTWVIAAPKAELLPDMAVVRTTAPSVTTRAQAVPEYSFTTRQLAVYGVYELQVLEDLLRRRGQDSDDVYRTVANRIRRKIDYVVVDGTTIEPKRFLEAFYRAQRARLESDLTFGKHRAHKNDRGR